MKRDLCCNRFHLFLDVSAHTYFRSYPFPTVADNGHSFDQVLFYGNEMSLIIFDTLLFCIVDLIWKNYLLDGIIVFLIISVSLDWLKRQICLALLHFWGLLAFVTARDSVMEEINRPA